jgi:hypothetical protein
MAVATGYAVPVELEELARTFHERQLDEPSERWFGLIHEDAEMTLVVNGFQPLRGRDHIIDSLENARQRMIYSAEVEDCESLDPATLFLRGQARYALQDGFATSAVFWLDCFRDGLLWRVEAFRTEAAARAAYKRG